MSGTEDEQARPAFTAGQLDRLRTYGEREDLTADLDLYCAGDPVHDLLLIDAGSVDIVRPAFAGESEQIVAQFEAGDLVGELTLLTGQKAYMTARPATDGAMYRISPDRFRALMDAEPDLSDLVLKALVARRKLILHSPANTTMQIIGRDETAEALALRLFAARSLIPHQWIEADSPAGQALVARLELQDQDLPTVLTPTDVLRSATPGAFAESVGLTYQDPGADGATVDLVVLGAGPAGLAAAMYGASEGLHTLLLDSVAAGGQAATSSRIENYLGFTSGISGAELTGKAAVQAMKFGARINCPCAAVKLTSDNERLEVELTGGTVIPTRAVVVATGAQYRSLPLPRWPDFEGSGIYYAATELEARACGGHALTVVGGANSAGQAAIFLAGRADHVTLVIRADSIEAGMSSYLSDRILAHPSITVQLGAEVVGLHGSDHLEAITIRTGADGATVEQDCHGLFCFIGAVPATDWLDGVIALDEDGFVLTDLRLPDDDLGPGWDTLGRRPLPFETSQPGVFAAGDVRAGSMKRVAAAVGEGASAVASVHVALGTAVN